MKEQQWAFMNRDIKRDEEGKWTYAGEKKESVTDYVIGDEKRNIIVVEEKLESDHNPIVVNIKVKKKTEGKSKKQEKSKWRKWDKKKKKEFRKKLKEQTIRKEKMEEK